MRYRVRDESFMIAIPIFIAMATVAIRHTCGEEAKFPNILFVMADDMGWGQTSYRNHPVLKTPNLDAMAANGLRFERFYAAASLFTDSSIDAYRSYP